MIVSKSLKYATVHIEAEEAEISRGPKPKVVEPDENRSGQTLQEANDFPMNGRFKGAVVVREDRADKPGDRDVWTILAREVEYDYAVDLLVATDAKMEIRPLGSRAPIKIMSPRLKLLHALERKPDGSPAPSKEREIRLDPSSAAMDD